MCHKLWLPMITYEVVNRNVHLRNKQFRRITDKIIGMEDQSWRMDTWCRGCCLQRLR